MTVTDYMHNTTEPNKAPLPNTTKTFSKSVSDKNEIAKVSKKCLTA